MSKYKVYRFTENVLEAAEYSSTLGGNASHHSQQSPCDALRPILGGHVGSR